MSHLHNPPVQAKPVRKPSDFSRIWVRIVAIVGLESHQLVLIKHSPRTAAARMKTSSARAPGPASGAPRTRTRRWTSRRATRRPARPGGCRRRWRRVRRRGRRRRRTPVCCPYRAAQPVVHCCCYRHLALQRQCCNITKRSNTNLVSDLSYQFLVSYHGKLERCGNKLATLAKNSTAAPGTTETILETFLPTYCIGRSCCQCSWLPFSIIAGVTPIFIVNGWFESIEATVWVPGTMSNANIDCLLYCLIKRRRTKMTESSRISSDTAAQFRIFGFIQIHPQLNCTAEKSDGIYDSHTMSGHKKNYNLPFPMPHVARGANLIFDVLWQTSPFFFLLNLLLHFPPGFVCNRTPLMEIKALALACARQRKERKFIKELDDDFYPFSVKSCTYLPRMILVVST